jgi:hypothetical protein
MTNESQFLFGFRRSSFFGPSGLVIHWSFWFEHWSFIRSRVIVSIVPPTTMPDTFSFALLFTLLLICGVSMATFMVLVRRWTTQRQWTGLRDWARMRGFRIAGKQQNKLPQTVASLLRTPPTIVLLLQGENAIVAQIHTGADRWNVLVKKTPGRRGAAALRPVHAPASLMDVLVLDPFPSLTVGHRFNLLGSSYSAARALADSASRTLVPQDLGLLVVEQWVVLDFSARPFDPIELDRMLALAQQVSQLA